MCDRISRLGPLQFIRVALVRDTYAAQQRYEQFMNTKQNKFNEAIKNHNQLLRLLEAYRQQKRLKKQYYNKSMMNLKNAQSRIKRLRSVFRKHNSDIYLYDQKGTLYGWKKSNRPNGNYRLESPKEPYCRQGAENVQVDDIDYNAYLIQLGVLDQDAQLKQTMAMYDLPQNQFQLLKFDFVAKNGRTYQSGWYPTDEQGKRWVNAFASDENYETFLNEIDQADQLITNELFFLGRSSQPNCSKVALENCGRTRGCEVKTSLLTRKRYCGYSQCSDADQEQCDFRTQCEWNKPYLPFPTSQASCQRIRTYPKKSIQPL